MKIKKYPQSCFMIESNDCKLLVDPGTIDYEEKYKKEWLSADVILITHKHSDHCNKDVLKEYTGKIYSSNEVKEAYPSLKIEVVKAKESIIKKNATISVVNAKHGYLPRLKNGNEIFENIGFIVNIEKKDIYFTSDTLIFKNDYKCNILCAPVSNHGLVMGPYELAQYAKETKAELVLPCHMDNPSFPVNIDELEKEFNKENINYKLLKYEEELKI